MATSIKKSLFSIVFLALISFVYTSCTSSNDPINNSVKTSGALSVSATTSTYNGSYAPQHVLAIWVESSSGTFVKSLLVNAAARKQYLTNWYDATSSGNSTDAVTGATLRSHGSRTCSWDGTDVSGNVVGDGTYNVCMELTQNNGTGKFASFTFTKGTASDSQTSLSKTNFSNVSLAWTPAAQ